MFTSTLDTVFVPLKEMEIEDLVKNERYVSSKLISTHCDIERLSVPFLTTFRPCQLGSLFVPALPDTSPED